MNDDGWSRTRSSYLGRLPRPPFTFNLVSVAERALVCVVTEAHGRTAVRAAVERLKSGAENSEPSEEETNAYGLVGKY